MAPARPRAKCIARECGGDRPGSRQAFLLGAARLGTDSGDIDDPGDVAEGSSWPGWSRLVEGAFIAAPCRTLECALVLPMLR